VGGNQGNVTGHANGIGKDGLIDPLDHQGWAPREGYQVGGVNIAVAKPFDTNDLIRSRNKGTDG
jgi:hypothetical protein